MTEIVIEIQHEVPVPMVLLRLIETAVRATLDAQSVAAPAEISCLLTDDAHIQELNRTYRQQDKPTDVLSFPAGDVPAERPGAHHLGDVAISVPYAKRQAQAAGHDLMSELQLLAVHGVLHLLGHDHVDDTEKAKMWAAQTAVLTELGIVHVRPTER